MKLRVWLVGLGVLIVGGINAYLLFSEEIPPTEQRARHLTVREDPLLDLQYTKGRREQNFKSFGLDAAMTAKAMDRMRDLDDRWSDKLGLLLEGSAEPTELADALCGQTNQVRPRYGALRFFVVEERGQRDAVRISRVTGLALQDWSRVAPIADVYGHVELAIERQPDATLMAVAALLLKRENDLLNNYAPWGRGFARTWSWARVKKEHPDIEERILAYMTLFHLAVELATGEDGICGQ